MHDFINNLKQMDFDPTDKEFRSVVLVSEKKDPTLAASQVFELEKAETFGVTAVYFRHFPKEENRSPLPQIYIYDNSQTLFSQERLAEIHRDLWSSCRIPMFIVIGKTDVEIFDTRKPVTVSGDNKLKTSPIVPAINFASEAVKHYSKKLFDNGIFWESKQAEGHFLESKSAYKMLIKDLIFVRNSFIKTKTTNLSEETANKLLVFSILIKYLEERGNENENFFAKDFFQESGANTFCDVLRQQGQLVLLFEKLSNKFNGRIFEFANEAEKTNVANANLERLADFLDADVELQSGQGYLWRKYSFNHLPVELISTVYETFLNERKDAVYTPEFLVNTLVDESMPQSDIDNASVKTIDVSCGSGIFLVSVFKRLVQRHRYKEFKETGKLKSLNSEKLLEIIKENIFGVDIEEDAVRLTVFSLCLALCDELKPQEIWKELKFNDTFKINFKQKNFFEYIENTDNFGMFDLVIGNPPFISLTIKGEKDENGNYIGKYKEKDSNGKKVEKLVRINDEIYQKTKKNIFPDNQTALMFLDLSSNLLKETGLLCLIMPSAPLLYNNSAEFKKQFFTKYQVSQIWDFTTLDAVLFGTAKVPTAAISARKQIIDEEKPITHVTIRRTKSVEQKIFFEIDKYDFHYVLQQSAINDKHVWKCNLLGGGRLNNLIDRFSEIDSIGSYVENKKKVSGWDFGEGYIIGKDEKHRNKKADFITGKPSLNTDSLEKFNEGETIKTVEELSELFTRPRRKTLYQPPVLIIKENIGKGKIPTYFSDTYLTYNQKMVGIASPQSDRQQLFDLHKSFEINKHFYRLFITATSNEYLVKRATAITEQDIMNLPYSEDKEEMQLSFVEQILCDDVLNYQIELLSKGSKAKVNEVATIRDLRSYGEVYNKLLNSIYGKSGKSFYLKKIYDLRDFYITEFNYGENIVEVETEERSEPTEHIKSLIENAYSSNVSIIRVLKLYEKNKVYFIKPRALRYWLRSTAIKDADEVFSDSLTQFVPNA